MHLKTLVFFLLVSLPIHALVWPVGSPPLSTDAPGPMRQAGSVHYSLFKVLGGSCVLISDRHLLTAAHGTRKWTASQLHIRLPHLTASKNHPVASIKNHPKADLALLTLKNPLSNLPTLTPLVKKPPRKGTLVWLGGFGLSGPLGTPTLPGTFHHGTSQIQGHRRDRLILRLPPKAPEMFPAVATAAAAKMDSGSPLFLYHRGQWHLAGLALTSNHRLTQTNQPIRNTYLDLARYRTWIRP